ncbi:hypothetical protein V5799_029425 [Amblyomma americanum]|uniref:Uncharacterized protein n=1 Tax=Amblyomma americanum TaxID=6943 RepID=A0AAQ4ERE8_AMBAM
MSVRNLTSQFLAAATVYTQNCGHDCGLSEDPEPNRAFSGFAVYCSQAEHADDCVPLDSAFRGPQVDHFQPATVWSSNLSHLPMTKIRAIKQKRVKRLQCCQGNRCTTAGREPFRGILRGSSSRPEYFMTSSVHFQPRWTACRIMSATHS